MTLLALDQDHPDERPRVAELLAMAVLGNLLIWQTGAEKDNPAVALWSQHNLSIKRYTRTLCLLYGSNPGLFQWIAEMAKMPDLRADWCEDEYQAARRGMEWLVSSYGDGRSGRSLRPNGRVSVEYGRPRSELQEAARQFLQKRQILERTAAFADTRFRFPQPFAVRVRACGQPNAFWDADDRELLFCYEMLEWLLQLSASPEVSRVAEAFAARRHDDAPGADAVR